MDVDLDGDSKTAKAMTCLLDLSHEMLHNVFIYVQPADLASLSRSCTALNSFIKGNTMLCKELYLSLIHI